VVADVTVSAQGAWALVLIEGNDVEDELELDGTLRAGAAAGAGIVVLVGGADPLNGDGVGAAVVVAGGAVCATAFVVAIRRTIPATAPRRSHRSGKANVGRTGIIAGDP
jgi:hypothetical protein